MYFKPDDAHTNAVTMNTWHYRLGHAPIEVLHPLFKCLDTKNTKFHFCNICPKAKLYNRRFGYSTTHVNVACHTLHMDG